MFAKNFVTTQLSKEFVSEYDDDLEKLQTEAIPLNQWSDEETAWKHISQTQIYYKQYKILENRSKFLYNIKTVMDFYKNIIMATNSAYLQRLARFNIIKSLEARKKLIEYGIRSFDGLFKLLDFDNEAEQQYHVMACGLHLAVIECEQADLGQTQDGIGILISRLNMME